MEYVTLGKTGLRVSVAALGCGGNSRLGLGRGKTEADAITLVRRALDMGVNLLDTAAAYRPLIGKAIKTVPRDRVVITSKALIHRGGTPLSRRLVWWRASRSLRDLDTDYIDVFQLHVVPPAMYDHAFHTIAPVLLREKAKGKFRALGITETSPNDHEQRMLQRAVHDVVWEVVMLGFNMMHHNARTQIFPHTIAQNIGTLLMFVVRNIFSQPGRLTARCRNSRRPVRYPSGSPTRTIRWDFLAPRKRCQECDRCGLSFCAARTRRARGAVRHEYAGAPAGEYSLTAPTAAPRSGPPATRRAVWPLTWCGARTPGSGDGITLETTLHVVMASRTMARVEECQACVCSW